MIAWRRSPRGADVAALPETKRIVSRHCVREQIENAILEGHYAPGVRLVQSRLAMELGVSRTIIREALMELKSTALIETIDNCGAVVRRADRKRLEECFEVREMVDGLAARLCCKHMTLLDLRELRALQTRMNPLYRNGDRDQYEEAARLDREFHLRLIRISHNELLEQLARSYWLLRKSTVGVADVKATCEGHETILLAIQRGKTQAAERAARAHVRMGRDNIIRLLDEGHPALRWLQ